VAIEIKNKTKFSADLYLYGDIVADEGWKTGDDDKCPTDVIEALKECEDVDEINLHINSAGGNVFAGFAIYNILSRCKAKINTFIDGCAASIASVIALAGDTVHMPSNSFIMIHFPYIAVIGNADELRESAENLDALTEQIIDVYVKHSKKTAEEFKNSMKNEKWFNAKEAAEWFNNIIAEEENSAAACVTEIKFKNAPSGFLKKTEIQNKDDADILNKLIESEEFLNEQENERFA